MDIERATIITGEKRGYRRGLILGLTMAESMLLLVFCLLLAAGAILIKEREDVKAAVVVRDTLKANLEELKDKYEETKSDLLFLQETVKKMPQIEKLPVEDWRELILAKEQIEKLEEVELTLTELVENSEAINTVISKKMTARDVMTAHEALEKLKAVTETNLSTEPKKINDIIDEVIRKATLYVENDGADMPHEWPPIINLSEADRHFFKSGSAELSQSFEHVLTDSIAHQIADTATQYAVDVIEVIGHTDEQRMARKASNLDEEIKRVLTGKSSPSELQPADNAGLGLARAIAVTKVLRSVPSLQHFTILPMSGAQLILPGDQLTDGSQVGDVASRRRIEIRVRKRNDLMQSNKAIP